MASFLLLRIFSDARLVKLKTTEEEDSSQSPAINIVIQLGFRLQSVTATCAFFAHYMLGCRFSNAISRVCLQLVIPAISQSVAVCVESTNLELLSGLVGGRDHSSDNLSSPLALASVLASSHEMFGSSCGSSLPSLISESRFR